eukprot:GEZU01020422.1.p1 GENE.GEZU01020422.1~~GEZU01020422.1.p1  ORF type:complete len:188 (-),score=41.47 GEZU01020422.1:24-587(-)
MAPEILKRGEMGYSQASDIWSLGSTVHEMLTGKIPYAELHFETQIDVMRHIAETGAAPRVPDNINISSDARSFLAQCFQSDPTKRPSASDLLKHAFVTEELADDEQDVVPESSSDDYTGNGSDCGEDTQQVSFTSDTTFGSTISSDSTTATPTPIPRSITTSITTLPETEVVPKAVALLTATASQPE